MNDVRRRPLLLEDLFSAAVAYEQPEVGITIRLLSPLGVYPMQHFRHSEAALVLRADIGAMLSLIKPCEEPEEYYTEIEFLSPYEIRLLSAIMLSQVTDTGAFCLYPVNHALNRHSVAVDLSNDATLNDLIDEFVSFMRLMPMYRRVHAPPVLGGQTYDINEWAELRDERQVAIFEAIDVSDHLLIRGLGALIRAGMLERFDEFLEHSGMALWVAMEASLEMVKRLLRANGVKNPSAKDAGWFLDEAFDSAWESDGYFVDFYEDRVKTVHPASRYGTFPGACLSVDDVLHLRPSLVHLYDFLITGHVPDELKGR